MSCDCMRMSALIFDAPDITKKKEWHAKKDSLHSQSTDGHAPPKTHHTPLYDQITCILRSGQKIRHYKKSFKKLQLLLQRV